MAYSSNPLVKEKDGVIAPIGFHYMPDGTLMSDAEHVAKFGYLEEKINSFTFETKDISHLGESRVFTIKGTQNAIFSLEIYDDSDFTNYYNFDEKTWSTTPYRLNNIELKRNYSFLVNFPTIVFSDATCDYNNDPTIAHDDDNGKIKAGMTVTGLGIPDGSFVKSVTSDTSFELGDALGGSDVSTTGGAVTNVTLTFGGLLKKYTINLYAETVGNIKTSHADFIEFENPDGTINLNKSVGSDSNLLMKTLHQDVVKNLSLSCVAPSLTEPSTNIVKGTVTDTKIVVDFDVTDLKKYRVGDKITETGIASSVHALVTKVDPDGDNVLEFETSVQVTATNDRTITFTPPFNSSTPSYTSTTGQDEFKVVAGGSLKSDFSITFTAQTGRTVSQIKTPTTEDLCAITTVTIGTHKPISGEDVSSSTYHRWPVDNIVGLGEGMVLDPARSGTGAETTTPAVISNYKASSTSYEINNRKYAVDAKPTTVTDVYVEAINSTNTQATTVDRDGNPVRQEGDVVFSVQQGVNLKDETVRIFAYGPNDIKKLTGMDVSISDVDITLTQISTTTTAAVFNSTTIPVTEAGNVSTLSTLRGLNVTSVSGDRVLPPRVTSKNVVSGAGNVVVATNQNLDNGQTIFFDGASNVATITGTIEISNMNSSDTTLYFDVERFLNCS